jgi:N-acyl homoserine lactone hydrolase
MEYDILLPGIPVASARGALGWCTVSIIRKGGRRILFDTGSHGDRGLLLEALKMQGLTTDQIDEVFVSHLHFDHFLNVDLFEKATIWVPKRDLGYVLEKEYLTCSDPYVPATMVRCLQDRLFGYEDGQPIVAGLRVMALPGHTPGLCGLLDEESRTLFAGDGVKNGWEFANDISPPAFFDAQKAVANYKRVWQAAETVVPGHDRPFRLTKKQKIEYLRDVKVAIRFWPGPEQEEKTIPIA